MATQTALPTEKAGGVRLPVRAIKLGTAATIAVAGAYGLLCDQDHVASSASVVSAYVLDVRTQSDGIVTALPRTVGTYVHEGEVLGKVYNTRLDRQPLESLRSEQGAAAAVADATGAERAALVSQRQALLEREAAHRQAVVARLEMQQAEEERATSAMQLTLAQANLDLDRSRKLHDAGILATAEYDKILSAQSVLTEQAAAEKAKLGSLEAQIVAALRGIYTEPGTGTDAGYSRQRADEIAMRIAESTRATATSRAQATLTQVALNTATQRLSQLEKSDILAPSSGVIWRFQAVDGEHTAAGDTILSLVDCTNPFLLVSIPQDRVPDIALHERATFRLSGEATERSGTVLSVIQSLDGPGGQKLASLPYSRPGEQIATVVVTVEPLQNDTEADGCIIGRTARVLLPTTDTNFASRLLHKYF